MLRTFVAVSDDITWRTSFTSMFVTAPVSGFSMLFTILGCTKTPLLAIALAAVIICKGVIVNLWPNDIVASSVVPTFSSLWNWLEASPDVAIPVLSNSPNALKYLYSVVAPIRWPNWIKAGLQEFSKAFLKDSLPCPDLFAQFIFIPETIWLPLQ